VPAAAAKQPSPEIKRWAVERRRAFADPKSAQAKEFADYSYKKSWGLYHRYTAGPGETADLELAHRLQEGALEIFILRDSVLEEAKSRQCLSIICGMLGRPREGGEHSRKAIECLLTLPGVRDATDWEQLEWLMRIRRGLADNSASTEERLNNCKEGFRDLERLAKRVPVSAEHKRYRAQFHRARGSALARQRPKTASRLVQAAVELEKAIKMFSGLLSDKKDKRMDISRAKVFRELSRVHRSLGRLKKAEAAILETVSIYRKHGSDSQWNHYHHAKVLWLMGKKKKALARCVEAVDILEKDRSQFQQSENRMSFLSDNVAVFDFAIYIAQELGNHELAHDIAQRCKARVFLERMRGTYETPKGTALAKDEAILEYHVGFHSVAIFVRRKGGLHSVRVPCSVDLLKEKIEIFEGFMRRGASATSEEFCVVYLRELAELLLYPILDHLEGVDRLHIVPSGVLWDLPFEALPLPDGRFAVEAWKTSYLPHAAMLGSRTDGSGRRHGGALALANPDGSLWHAEAEAEMLAKTFSGSRFLTGARAKKSALYNLDGTRILHLACHGRFEPSDPLSSCLLLAPDRRDDGILTVREIAGLRLKKLDLAFLSGCFTGRGKHIGRDEIYGLSHAFLQAGAKSVVVALWEIEDLATRDLVSAFYKAVKEGKGLAAALQEAKVESLPKARHPYYWAAFKLIGI